MDRSGRAAVHTGPDCTAAAGHALGDGVVTAGNLVAGEAVWRDMLRAYDGHAGPFEERLLVALEAGEAAGGDVRGRQSAALVVTAADGFYEIDIRVDDSPDPVTEIGRVLTIKNAHDLLRISFCSDVDGAAETLRSARALAPDDPLVTVWSAIAHARAGDWDSTAVDLARAAKQNRHLVDYLAREPALRDQPEQPRLIALAKAAAV